MKMNLSIFKNNTVWWIVGGILLFVIFYMFASQGADNSGGGTALVSSGPSEGAQLQMASMSMQSQLAQMGFAAQSAQANTESQTAIALATIAAGLENKQSELEYNATMAALDAQREMTSQGYQYSLDTARVTAETNIAMYNIDRMMQKDVLDSQTEMVTSQMAYNAKMFETQMQGMLLGQAITQLGDLSKGSRKDGRRRTLEELLRQYNQG